MTGENCAVVGCGSNRRNKGIGIFKIPSKSKGEWRSKWLSQITKSRVITPEFKNKIVEDLVYACEKHFEPEEIKIRKLPIRYYINKIEMSYNTLCKTYNKVDVFENIYKL